MKFLIDTNICIYLMNQRPLSVIQKFKKFTLGEIGVSSITVSELQYGITKSQHSKKNQERLDKFLIPFDILVYDEAAARVYGDIRTQLEKEGQVIGPLDMLIAAHALSLNLIIVTNNDKECSRIKNLKIENWT